MESNPYAAPTADLGAAPLNSVDPIHGLEVTWGHAVKVWWSLVWRGGLLGMLFGLIGGLIVGIICGVLGVPAGTITLLGNVVGFAGGLLGGFMAMKMVLQKSWSNFRIVLVPRNL